MKQVEVDSLVSRAGRVNRRALERPSVQRASEEVLEAILAEPRTRRGVLASPLSGRRWRHKSIRAGAIAATAVATVLFAISIDLGGNGSPTPALAAERTRLAAVSPHLLLGGANWRIQAASQRIDRGGSIRFLHANASYLGEWVSLDVLARAELDWRSKRYGHPFAGRGAGLVPKGKAEVLPGVVAEVAERSAPGAGPREYVAIWADPERYLRFRSFAASLADFERRLSALRRVERGTWVRALPRHLDKHDSWTVLEQKNP